MAPGLCRTSVRVRPGPRYPGRHVAFLCSPPPHPHSRERFFQYASYIFALDAVKKGYNELRAKEVGLSLTQFQALDLSDPEDRALYDRARNSYPMRISEAEPSKIE